jgi:hypothetical protein
MISKPRLVLPVADLITIETFEQEIDLHVPSMVLAKLEAILARAQRKQAKHRAMN